MKWYEIICSADGGADVYLLDEIGGWGVSAGQFVKAISGIKGKITLHINSPGGSVFEGLAIYNILRSRDVDVIVEGLAASMASVIAMSGKTIKMAKNSMLMIHNPVMWVSGEAVELRKMADLLDTLKNQIVEIYSQNTSIAADTIATLMSQESWFTADEAKELGFCDEVIGGVKVAATFSDESFVNKEKYEKYLKNVNGFTPPVVPISDWLVGAGGGHRSTIKEKKGNQMEEILKLLGVSDETEAVSAINKLILTQKAMSAKIVEQTIDSDIMAGKLLPRQKDFAMKMLQQGEADYTEYLKSCPDIANLGKKDTIVEPVSQDDRAVYQRLLDNPDEYCKLSESNPALLADLVKRFGGK